MYERYFGLKEKPFRLTPDPRFLYLSKKHAEALDHLIYGITQGEGFMVISGDVGTGKTTVIRSLLDRLSDPKIETALILNPLLEIDELLKSILEDFGITPQRGSKKDLIDQLNAFLLSLNQEGKKGVVIVDESQNLAPDLLEELRSLSNLETHEEKLLQIVLVGQLELWNKLNDYNLRQLKQRISVSYRLEPLSLKEVGGYIQHRLSIAGFKGSLGFSSWAMRLIYRATGGIPRLINLLSDRILLVLYLEQSMQVNTRHVRKAMESLKGGKGRSFSWRSRTVRRMAYGLMGGLLLFAGTLSFHWLSPRNNTALEATLISGDTARNSLSLSTVTYAVHVASYKKKEAADKEVKKIQQEGLEAFQMPIRLPETGSWYRVMVGQYESREEALSLANRLKQKGVFPFCVVTSVQQVKGPKINDRGSNP
ncbi:MAG TPA: AAA family ATPase [Thermodesulfobacteriota bacterium]|nr:AAA family ATPase [Thermodesulfobacteriota bacterium]